MQFMTNHLLLLAAVFCLVFGSHAAVPPAEKMLPDDTLILLTTPDWTKAKDIFSKSPQGQFWNDPAMKPFRDKFTTKLKEDVLTPLERDLGVRWEDWTGFAQGQITFALIQNGWPVKEDQKMGWLLFADTRDKSGQLRTNLADLKKKWVDSGKQIKTEKIRDVEFTTLVLSSNDLIKSLTKALPVPAGSETAFEEPGDKKTTPKSEIIIGQSDALFIMGNSAKTIEKILIALAGGSVPMLGDLPAYQASHNALFRESPAYGWVNAKLLINALSGKPANSTEADSQPNTFLPPLSKITTVLGLNGLKTGAVSYHNSNEGGLLQFFLGIPEADRRGLFKVLAFEAKEASPPTFVPADAAKFQRWRIDGQKAWAALETMINEFSPQLGGFLQMTMATIGKDQDANFDFKKTFLGNLGNDVITYEKAPSGATQADLQSPPSILLLGSPNAELLALALKSGTALMPPQLGGGNPVKEREFLGRKIFTLPAPTTGSNSAGQRGLHFSASGGYVAMSSDAALLEQYLRSSESQGKTLRESPGLNEAAQPVGGTSTGLFGYSNQGEIMRATFEVMKKNPNVATNSNNLAVLGSAFGISVNQNNYNNWFDYSLLPEFEKVAKYFHFSVYAGSTSADGLTLKTFSPTPPQLKK